MNCAGCGALLGSAERFCHGCGRPVPQGADATEPQAPPELIARGKLLMLCGALGMAATLPLLFLDTLLASISSVLGTCCFVVGWGLRHGAVWASFAVPGAVRDDPRVHAYVWGDELCPGCAETLDGQDAYCPGCGHAICPSPEPFGAAVGQAFSRLFKAQPVEAARTVAYRKREPHETTDRFLVWGLVLIAGGFLISNVDKIIGYGPVFGSSDQLLVAALVVVPAVPLLLWLRGQDRFEPEPWTLLLIAFGWGMLSGLLVMPANTLLGALLGGTAMHAGLTEELAKPLIVVLFATHRTIRKEINGPTDGMIYAGCAGIGFAAMENFGYVLKIWYEQATLFGGVAGRSAGLIDHMTYAGITGSFLGLMLLRNGRLAPRDLFVGFLPAAVIHAFNNSLSLWGPFALVLFIVPSAVAAWGFFKLLSEALRDEAFWGYDEGEAPIEEVTT